MENKSRAFGLGIFIVVALLILATGVFLIGDKQFLFSSTYRLTADFPNVSGLNEGADVRVGGVRKGTVIRIDLTSPPERKVAVAMKMDMSSIGVIRKDSSASIKTEGILGDKYVEISFGSKDAPTVADGDVIRAEPTVDMAEVANSVAQQTKAALAVFQEDMEALKQNFLLRGFFNKRGYEDTGDLTKHTVARLPASVPVKEFSFEARQLFARPDGAKLKNQKTLDEAGRFLEGSKFGLVVVAASAGATGDSEKELVLMRAQAMVVREYLVQNFSLDDTRIKIIGLGKSRAATDSGKVQVLVYAGRPPGQSKQAQPAGGH